jgi:enoyl-CoA hydratase/carnithine racemase
MDVRYRAPATGDGFWAEAIGYSRRMDMATGSTTISPELADEAESHGLLTLGVEEEYLLVESDSPRATEAVEEVAAEVPDDLREYVQHEFQRSQIEAATPPELELRSLFSAMSRLRPTRPSGRGRGCSRSAPAWPRNTRPGSPTSRATTGCASATATSPPAPA